MSFLLKISPLIQKQGTFSLETNDTSPKVRFFFHTDKNNTDGYEVHYQDFDELYDSHYNPIYPTRILIHDYLGYTTLDIINAMKDAYLSEVNPPINVLRVIWDNGDDYENYSSARQQVTGIAEKIALYIDYLCSEASLKLTIVSIIGHGIGAHIAGITGQYIKDCPTTLNTIIGLDPTEWQFDLDLPDERLSSDDANYVEIIHTSDDIFGIPEPIGVADFYPNGGSNQLGCINDVHGYCSHARAGWYFVESITSVIKFWGNNSDDDFQPMGEKPTNLKMIGFGSGIYELSTASSSPFALGINIYD